MKPERFRSKNCEHRPLWWGQSGDKILAEEVLAVGHHRHLQVYQARLKLGPGIQDIVFEERNVAHHVIWVFLKFALLKSFILLFQDLPG